MSSNKTVFTGKFTIPHIKNVTYPDIRHLFDIEYISYPPADTRFWKETDKTEDNQKENEIVESIINEIY